MDVCVGKSEGKKPIHRAKAMFTKYLISAISVCKKIYMIIVSCYSTFFDFC